MEHHVFSEMAARLEKVAARMEALSFEEYVRYARNWKRRLISNLFYGIARGLGFSIGFTILGALVLYVLKNIALANLPIIGKSLAELVRIVERNL